MNAEYARGRRSAGEIQARSWIEGEPARPPLSEECALDFGFCIGVASAELGRHREAGCDLLAETMRLMARTSAQNASQGARALEQSFTQAVATRFHGRLPAVGFGIGFLLLMPHWGVSAFKLAGNACLWRRERSGALIEVARENAGGTARRWGAPEAPLLVSGGGDRLLLATGGAAGIATRSLAASIDGLSVPRSLILGFCRAVELPGVVANGSLLVVATEAGEMRPLPVAQGIADRAGHAALG